jgi:Methylase involved in ubiquinone/menaquinone biosynthesis
MPFREDELDVIWSEGAIYNIGYQKGLTEWRRYLKQGGYIAVSEATWFTNERPAEINDYWMDAYPEIDTVANKILQMQKAGYSFVSAFVLPENCWTDHYYALQVPAHESLCVFACGVRRSRRIACALFAARTEWG